MARVKPFVFMPKLHSEPLAVLVSSIVSQQLSTKVAATILQRVHALIAIDGHPDARKLLKVSEAALRKAGLSRMKVAFLKDLAQKSVDGVLPSLDQLQRMSDEQIVRAFTKIKGIGRWTVEMFLIFNLGRTNVFPVLDFGVRKAFGLHVGLRGVPAPEQLEPYREHWSPYCSVAALYLWRSLDNA
jgi:3-methyladenine DNA glycosylase/8-oxoguanine DNA glycosylase